MKAALISGGCLLMFLCGRTALRGAEVTTSNIEERINRVVSGVLAQDPNVYYKFDTKPLKERMEVYHTPGVSIAVINHGKIEWARGFGVAEWGETNPVTETTLFQAASLSKAVFAMGVMRLVEEGKLDLDRDVNTYLKSWKVPPNKSGQPKVTLREILGHTAGFAVHGFGGYETTATLPTLVEILNGTPPAKSSPEVVTFTPGSQFRYSGGGIEVGQQVVEDVTGRPFPEFMRDTVLGPLGMKHSTYEEPLPKAWEVDAASGHYMKYNKVKGRWHVYPEMAAAGLWTTPSDLARVGMDMQRAVTGKSGTLLKKKLAAEMLKPGLSGVGISFFISGTGESTRFGHSGANEGFRSQMTFYEHEGLGCVVMVNADEGAPLVQEIDRAVAREYKWPEYFPKEPKEITLGAEHYDALAGQYWADREGKPVVIIQRKGEQLMARLFGQRDHQIFPESETNFFFRSVDAQMSFEHNRAGKVTGLILHQNTADLPFTKFSDKAFEAHKPLSEADSQPRTNSVLQGNWECELGNPSIHLVARIAELSTDQYRGEMDSPDQHANGQVLSVICHPPEVKFVVMTGHGMFSGKINADDTALTGDWIQGGEATPVTFRRVQAK